MRISVSVTILCLHSLKYLLLELAFHLLHPVSNVAGPRRRDGRTYWLAGIIACRFTVKGKESTKIELGRLEQLNLSYVDLGIH
jgi:hypothetical protein